MIGNTGPLVVRLHGGLGNQMFQYAFGRALSRRGAGKVLFDDSSYSTDALRSYELDVWRVNATLLSPADRDRLPRRYGGRGVTSWFRGRGPLRPLTEKPLGFDPRYLTPRPSTYLSGYWQSERFFQAAADELRDAFQPSGRLTEATTAVLRQVERVNSVAIHIRRTDYLQLPHMQVCDLGYYERCLAELLGEQSGVEAFVFSDDLAWCRDHMRAPCPVHYVGHTTAATAYEDLWLMSRCRHRVIPNSSFSWWASWLCPVPGAIHFAPTPWFDDPAAPGDDVVPTGWRSRAGKSDASVAA